MSTLTSSKLMKGGTAGVLIIMWAAGGKSFRNDTDKMLWVGKRGRC